MKGAFIVPLLSTLFSASIPRAPIHPSDFVQPDATNIDDSMNGGRRRTVAHAKREARKAKARRKQRRACR
ncbi:MAG TPA: hypothetical protein PLO14_16335 [Accumulibacter sp.]|uniref:hypothetical protein n=1 Tax=Accumulibacter sp. TaxID=2053492 RepID=UPI002CADBB00|nr:hypothetical protein [Accumulibacter sp.]HNC53771.1 hypothetical protein [Accumulibacter sp.]